MTCLAAVHAVLPPNRYPQDKITEAFAEHVLGDGTSHEVVRRIHTNTRVGSRYLALPLEQYRQLDGFTAANDATGRKLKYLRHIPVDPMTRGTEWGMRSYQDKPDATRWGGQNVFDVYTTFDGKALDGTKYKDW